MKPLNLLVAGAASASAADSYLARMADSFIRHGVEKNFHYTQATLYEGFQAAYAASSNATILEWYRGQIDGAVVRDDGTIAGWDRTHYSLDDYRIGNSMLWWHERTGAAKYEAAAAVIREQLNRHPRTPSGGFWHRSPVYADQMWLDGIFMADTFYARWTARMDAGNGTAWDDVARQFDNIEAHCRNRTTGLLVHGYDESKRAVWADPATGASPLVWSRAVGWYLMALLEVIDVFPEAHAGYGRLVGYFTTLAAALLEAQDAASGGWWLILSEPYPAMAGNYIESSASAMFTLGWLRGMRMGLLPEDEYLDAATAAYHALVDRFVVENGDGTLNWEGTVQVGSLSGDASYEYYTGVPVVSNDYKGVGPFMLASYEWEALRARLS